MQEAKIHNAIHTRKQHKPPYTAENAIWGRKLLCISERLHISAKTKIIPVFQCRSVHFTAFCSLDLPTHPLRTGFILLFISQFHLQCAEWINETHQHVSVWFDGPLWNGPRCNSSLFHCGDQRQSASRRHLRAQQDRAALLGPPSARFMKYSLIIGEKDWMRANISEVAHGGRQKKRSSPKRLCIGYFRLSADID